MTVVDQAEYVEKVLALYLALPETPTSCSTDDRLTASELFRRQLPLETVEAAFLLASARRLFRDPSLPPLSPIRSLRYFLPIMAEISASSFSQDYLRYLRRKLDSFIERNKFCS